tara:strand:- start:398 stop:691 length:294 start_codon:yes stop_codon:yes gene_type:complete
MEQVKFAEYKAVDTQIKKDGHVMLSVDVAKELNRKSFLEEELSKLKAENADLNKWVNNTLEALDAVKASGEVSADDVLEMIELGLSGKPQKSTTRLS